MSETAVAILCLTVVLPLMLAVSTLIETYDNRRRKRCKTKR